MIFLAIMVLGCVSYLQLPVQLIPDFTMPVIGIYARTPKSAKETLEEITKKVEGIVAEMPKVKHMRSSTWSGGMWMMVEFEYGTDTQYSLVDLEERLATFRNSVDDRRTYIDAWPYSTADFQTSYMFLSVRGRADSKILFKTASEQVEERLKSISGVSNVEISGLRSNAVEVQFNTDLLSSYKLDIGRVIGRVQSAARDDSYLGQLDVPGEKHYVRLDSRISTPDELGDLIVDGKGVVRLRDVATIYTGESVDRWMSRSDGKNSIDIRMERESSRNLIDLARETRKRIDEINETLPPGVEVVIDEDLAKYVEDAINDVKTLALLGALLALFVPLIFFRSLRVALIVFLSVPISLIAVFNLFYATNMSINIFSIVGLALGVGMLVDNSIVVVENAFRLYNRGVPPKEAASQGGVDVGRGLLAATMTTVAVFVPLVFLDGMFKLIVKEPTLALVFPLIMSLFTALTIVPVFTWLVLRSKKRKPRRDRDFPIIYRWYMKLLKGALRHRGRVIALITLAIFFTSVESCQRVNQAATSNEAKREYMQVYFRPISGTTLSDVNNMAVGLEDRLLEHKNLKSFGVSFNKEGGRSFVRFLPVEERENRETFQELRDTMLEFLQPIPGLELSLQSFNQNTDIDDAGPNLGTQGSLALKGLDKEVITAYAERLIMALRSTPEISNAELKDRRGDELMTAILDREKTRLFDIKANTIGQYINTTKSGGTVSSLRLINGEERTDVSFTLEESNSQTVSDAKALTIYSPKGPVPLSEIATFKASRQEGRTRRRDRQSSINMTYYYERGADQGKIIDSIKHISAVLPNPGGVVLEFTGDAQRIDRRGGDAFFIIIWGAVLVWVVMAAVFESFWVPFAILATNPLMLMGIIWGLDIADLPMDDLAFFGIILLVGLAVNNGIVMMDRALSLQRDGFSRTRSVFEAAVTRLRPIMMTYLTTVLGLLPLAMVGEADDQWRPVAVVVIGGLTSATMLTLIVLPCFYLIGDDFVNWLRKPAMNFLKGMFEIPEAAAHVAFHPIRVYRRELSFLPNFRLFFRSVFSLSWELVRTPLKILFFLPSDLRYILFTKRRRARWDREDAGIPEKPVGFIRRTLRTIWWFIKLMFRLAVWPIRMIWRLTKWCFKTIWRIIRWMVRLPIRIWRWLRKLPPPEPKAVKTEPEPIELPVHTGPIVTLSNIQMHFPSPISTRIRSALPSRLPLSLPKGDGIYEALKGIHLGIDHGLFGLLGPNGAGKTTLMRILAGLMEPTRGTVRLFNSSHREAPGQLAPLIGFLPQTHGHYNWMTLYQYLDYFATLMGQTITKARALASENPVLLHHLMQLDKLDEDASRHRAIKRVVKEVNLTEVLHETIGSFSGGMKQRAGLARLLLQAPPILIVDEPTAGLDPVERMRIRLLLTRLAEKRLVLVSTHIIDDLDQGCDRLAILKQGALLWQGHPEELRDNYRGKVWDMLLPQIPHGENKLLSPENKLQKDHILSRFQREGVAGIRVLSETAPHSQALKVTPTLEDAVLATLKSCKI